MVNNAIYTSGQGILETSLYKWQIYFKWPNLSQK